MKMEGKEVIEFRPLLEKVEKTNNWNWEKFFENSSGLISFGP